MKKITRKSDPAEEAYREKLKRMAKLGYFEIIKKGDPDYNPEYFSIRLTQKYKDEYEQSR